MFCVCTVKISNITFRPGFKPIEKLMHITSVGIEDGSGDSWIVGVQSEDFSEKDCIYYSTKSRKGTFFSRK